MFMKWPSLNCVWGTTRPIPISWIPSFSLMNVYLMSENFQTLWTLVCIKYSTETPKEIWKHELHNEKFTGLWASYANGAAGSYYFNKETVEGVDYFRILDAPSSQKFNSPCEMLFSSCMELHLTLHPPSVLFWRKFFRAYGLKDLV